MVTMLDVAKRAGVSKATVSRVLNGKNVVSAEVVAAVFKAIEETGYRPNLLARQLATRKTRFIGFVMTNALYNGPYFSTLVYHAAAFSEQHGYQLVMADGKHSADDERSAINFLLDMKCAGILVYPQYLDATALTGIMDEGDTPIVVLNRQLPHHQERSVVTDHYHSAALLMDHLLEQGHRDIAFICGRPGSATGGQRYAAYQDRLALHGIALDSNKVLPGDWTPESGYDAVETLLNRGVAFTAVLAGNDEMAFGAIKALHAHGVRIPQQVSIAGFDNNKFSAFVTPGLTSVSVPLEQMVQKGILLVLGEQEKAAAVNLSGSLMVRESVARAS
ncbi:transcriptional regulator, LacI family [Aeromonas sp. RU39B]|uniref:LacI family DNA-binding transcriptional regulator n=1 Tax=Aeromonas sp. RU39B TaxID=1907416 RepID=UPI0009545033|nr:LacI family DNA-binding transcriptional regulator [Aeromonas sp. RU39B]SIR04284.1 transcriptional regulator, LacI family [Aeromonas sp. RU39B]